MSELSEYFLGSQKSVVLLHTLEISHPNFSQTYRIVRNAVGGITAGGQSYVYYPTRITKGARGDDLNFSIQADFGDLGEIVPAELDAIRVADGFDTKPTVIYRSFRSDDLDAPLDGPYTLEADQFACDAFTCSFVAAAPQLNLLGTGENYTLARFPMLRGLL